MSAYEMLDRVESAQTPQELRAALIAVMDARLDGHVTRQVQSLAVALAGIALSEWNMTWQELTDTVEVK